VGVAFCAYFCVYGKLQSTRARLCLRAAGELEKRKQVNKRNIDARERDIHNAMNELETSYRANCELRKVGFYDAFKLQKNPQDFDANLKRLALAGC
jgi:enhanced disease susceptibility 1 protein